MIDDDMLDEDDELAGAGIPLLDDEDGDVGIVTGDDDDDDDDEMEGFSIKDENGDEVEDEH